ncbi:hypothetical protein M9Y10_019143 [Tritrichomonas musculus]|uniref:Nucleoporin Nup159/Nup146 N-terminal domain-containing protein n=1 Tax=Tritrichomonas musculus TaxID=1915356 RepID=A0ABR2HKH2_9EUKA
MSRTIDLLDPDVILKYGTNTSAVDDFERFAQSYLELHDKYDYSMIKRIEETPYKVGFIDDIYHFYVLTDSSFIIYETNQETGEVSEFYRLQTSNKVQNVSQNPHNPYLFALLANGKIMVFNLSTKESQEINLEKKVAQVSWLSNNSCLVCLYCDLSIAIIDLDRCQVQTTNSNFESKIDSHFLISHPNHNIVAICDDQLRLIDFRDSAKIRNFVLKKEATSISWLPQDYFGCAVGYSDGCIDFFSLDKNSVVMTQNVISQPIRGIEFCPTNSCSVSLIVDKDIIFVSMPSWGFGSLGKVASYKMHLSPIVDAHWISDDINTSMITCDNDNMIHIFDVPEEYMPIYEP